MRLPFDCIVFPRTLEFKRTPLTGGRWLEHGAIASFEVIVQTQQEYDDAWNFLERVHGGGESFVYKINIHNTNNEKEYYWKILALEPYDENIAYSKIKFRAQVIADSSDPVDVTCGGSPVTCDGENVTMTKITNTYPRRR